MSEIVSHVDTKGLEGTLGQLQESKQIINEVVGDLIFNKYGNMLHIDEHMNEIQTRASKLGEDLEEYKISMQKLEMNIVEDIMAAQKAGEEDAELDDYSKYEFGSPIHSISI